MTFRTLKTLVPACAALIVAAFVGTAANAAPLQKSAALHSGSAQLTLVDHRDGRYRGDRGRDRGHQWRGRDDRRYGRSNYRPYAPRYLPPRYVYAPPAYYSPYDSYYDGYDGYYPSAGYFSYSSPTLGFSFGY
jgi:hypothetical protein